MLSHCLAHFINSIIVSRRLMGLLLAFPQLALWLPQKIMG
jgi:hypothetical protein